MSQQELLIRVVAVLEAAGAGYMLSGSWASSLQGEPRSTHDIDLLVAITPPAADALVAHFHSPDYYLDRLSIDDAIARSSQFNLIEIDSGYKVDFWILSDDPFIQTLFERRYVDDLGGSPIYVSRPEDTILLKLRWAAMCGGSEKQINDAIGVYEVQRGALDMAYIEHWARHLGVTDAWDRIRRDQGVDFI